MLFVTGGTGNIGQHVVRGLSQAGITARVLVRDPARAAHLRMPGIELVTGDLAKPESYRGHLAGVTRAFLVTGPDPAIAELQNGFIDGAARAGVRHVVKMSALGATPKASVLLGRLHASIESHLRASGMAWTIVQPGFFATNFLGSAASITGDGRIYGSAGDGRAAFLDPRDIAGVVVAALTGSGHEGKTYVLTGTEALTHAEVASRIAAAIGREVTYVNLPDEAYASALLQAGLPGWFADEVVGFQKIIRGGWATNVTSTISDVTGRPARSLEQFLADHKSAFAAVPAL